MVPTAIYFKSPGITSQLLLVQAQYLEFHRQLDGLFRMEVLIVLLNLLRAVSPCEGFLRFTAHLLGIYPFFCRIFFPILADQPVTAAHVTENLHAAFELFHVRSGEGVKPLHRNEFTPVGSREAVSIEVRQTIDLCRSEKGHEIRSNAEKLKVKFAKAWEEDGVAKQEMRKFLHKYA
jgi:hypothetical protein